MHSDKQNSKNNSTTNKTTTKRESSQSIYYLKRRLEMIKKKNFYLKNSLLKKNEELTRVDSFLKEQIKQRKNSESNLKNVSVDLEKNVEDRTTELKKVMEERVRTVERWRAIFENVEEGILILDNDMNIVQMNDAAERLSGITKERAVGKKYYNVFKCKDSVGNSFPDFCPVEKVCITREPLPYDEHLHSNSSGKNFWVGVSYTPIFSKSDVIEQIVCVVRDITALKEVEKAKSEFVSIASHELRTPLTVINGYLSLLLSGDIGDIATSPARVREAQVISKIYKESKRLTKLVEYLLNVSRIEGKRLKLNLKELNLRTLIDEVTSEYRPLASAQGIAITAEGLEDLKDGKNKVMIDEDRMKQVLVNLVDNSLKFTKAGGKIIIKCSEDSGKIITEISDTGIGINKELMPRIFEKFQQEPGSYLKENKGTGLGLFIVKSIVELHNGSIQAKSSPGKGTTFKFILPTVA